MSNIWIITAILKENLAFIAKNHKEKFEQVVCPKEVNYNLRTGPEVGSAKI